MDLVRAGVVRADKVATDRFSLEESQKGFATVSAAQDTVKTLIIIEPKEAAS